MGRKLVSAGFLACLALALYIFWTRDTKSLRDSLSKGTGKEPRLVLEDFSMYRYRDETLIGKLSARLGHFYDPNVVELDGEIRAERLTSTGERETLGAESATGYLKASNLIKMMDQNTELERAELSGFVEVGLKDHLLTTDYAEYLNGDKLVRSHRPVRVEGPGRVFMGDEGFTYGLESEILDMQGPVKGVVSIDQP